MPGKPAAVATEQILPTGDEPYPDDEEAEAAPRYESDFAYFKPRADLLLSGTCHAPRGEPVEACRVSFHAGSNAKSIVVYGDRVWKGLVMRAPSEPEPFTQMPLRYERSFGGSGFKKNPVGKGYGSELTESGDKIYPLPNLEDPSNLIVSASSRPDPAGFGPLKNMWQDRFSLVGTYKTKWLNERWPAFPEDFDWGFYNAAPADMQAEGYLKGNENLTFENLHPTYPIYKSQLPGIRVRCFLNGQDEKGRQSAGFQEVAMNLDTLWVDMDSEKLVLVWRGWAPVRSDEYEQVQHAFIISESLDEPVKTREQCRDLFVATLAQEEAQWAPKPEEPKDQAPDESIDQPSKEQGVIETPEEKEAAAKLQADYQALCAKYGLDPDNPPPLSPEAERERDRLLREMEEGDDAAEERMVTKALEHLNKAMVAAGITPTNPPSPYREIKADLEQAKSQFEQAKAQEAAEAEETQAWTREKVQERIRSGSSLSGEDLSGLDLSDLDMKGVDFSEANLSGAVLNKGDLSDANLAHANLAEAQLAGAFLKCACLEQANGSQANLDGADLSEATLTGAQLEQASLVKAKLGQVKAEQCNLTGADLKGADLSGAQIAQAVFTKAKLEGARLEGVNALGAYFIETDLTGANLCGTALGDAILEKAQLQGARLDQAKARGAYFAQANLGKASLRDSQLDQADFSKAILDGADFQGASLRETSVDGAKGVGVNMAQTDLTKLRASEGVDFSQGCFQEAQGAESIWEKAKLDGADFSYADMEGAFFVSASLKGATFYRANMKFARFSKADCQEAKFIEMNCFEGSFEKVNLTSADLTGSNMYGAEFLEAITNQTHGDNVNLKMTKLYKK